MSIRNMRQELAIALKSDAHLAREMIGETYRLGENGESITCLLCGQTSHNLNDVSEKYCARCGVFHADVRDVLPPRNEGNRRIVIDGLSGSAGS